ncbi:MAG: hypothetical protein JW885_09595 [Deltaproteobacteria bacterium]|nr:hypothetical protein [Candidatus Zymogenaceae bacterium]
MKKFFLTVAVIIIVLGVALAVWVVGIGDLSDVAFRDVPDVVRDDATGMVYVGSEESPEMFCVVEDIDGKARILRVQADDRYLLGYLKARAIGDEMIAYMETVDGEVTDYAGGLMMMRVKKKSRYYWEAIEGPYRDEILGITHGLRDEGYDVKAADVLFAFTWRELVYVTLAVKIGPIYYKLFYSKKHPVEENPGGCSAFGMLNPDGSVIIAQTIDSPPQSKGFGNYYFEEQTITGEENTTTMTSYAGLFGWAMGWNDNGVCVVINNMFTSEYGKEPRLPYTFRGREALRVSSDAYEYIDFWVAEGSPNAQNFIVTDLDGNLLRLERSREEFHITDVAADGLSGTYWEDIGMLTSTNTFVTDTMKHLILFPDVCTGRQPTADRVAGEHAADGFVTLDDMMDILAYQPEGLVTDENAICYRTEELIAKKNTSVTVYQLIFEIKNGKRSIYMKENFDCGDREYVSPPDPRS